MIELKPIKPRVNPLNADAVMRAVRDEMHHIAEDAKEDFERTTAEWEHEVDFEVVETRDGVVVATEDEIYGYVDEGTKPHDITPKKAKALRFGAGGAPKTRPRVIGSGAGSRGNSVVYTRRVRHPGTEAREFSKTIQEKYERQIGSRIAQAIGDALERGGD